MKSFLRRGFIPPAGCDGFSTALPRLLSRKMSGKRGKRSSAATRPRTLAIDIGGSHIKASVLDPAGKMLAAEVFEPTPHPTTPRALLGAVGRLADRLPAFERISAGFPGYVKRNVVYTRAQSRH